jgi:hypothetical protein
MPVAFFFALGYRSGHIVPEVDLYTPQDYLDTNKDMWSVRRR